MSEAPALLDLRDLCQQDALAELIYAAACAQAESAGADLLKHMNATRLALLLQALDAVRYGEVHLVIADGRVTTVRTVRSDR